jgi:hypothetical protein
MNPNLKNVSGYMYGLGLGALKHSIWHSHYSSFENEYWPEMSVLQASHAAEILIKAKIAEEHPLLIFEQVPRSTQIQDEYLDFEHLIDKAKTIQYNELPERLWAATGLKITNLDAFKKFGSLRNNIQHFAAPRGVDCSLETMKFIFEVVDPFINKCWGLFAIDYNEDSEPYEYLFDRLIRNEIKFLVSPESAKDFQWIESWTTNKSYRVEMEKRFKEAGCTDL